MTSLDLLDLEEVSIQKKKKEKEKHLHVSTDYTIKNHFWKKKKKKTGDFTLWNEHEWMVVRFLLTALIINLYYLLFKRQQFSKNQKFNI